MSRGEPASGDAGGESRPPDLGEQIWSVCLVIDETWVNELSNSDVWEAMFGPGVESISFRASEEGTETASVVITLSSSDGPAAEGRAQNLLFQGLKAIGVSIGRDAPVAWVLPIQGNERDGARFFAEAEEMIGEGRAELAIVAAHIYLEQQVRALIERGVGTDRESWMAVVMAIRSIGNLNSATTQKMIEALFGVKVTQLPDWDRFLAHASRRNAVVHEGQPLEVEHARESIATVRGLVMTLGAAAREREGA